MDYYHTTTFLVPLELLDSVRAWALVPGNQAQLLEVQLGDRISYSIVIHDVAGHTDQSSVFAREFGLEPRAQ